MTTDTTDTEREIWIPTTVAESIDWFLQKDRGSKVWMTAWRGKHTQTLVWVLWVKPGNAHHEYIDQVLCQRWETDSDKEPLAPDGRTTTFYDSITCGEWFTVDEARRRWSRQIECGWRKLR